MKRKAIPIFHFRVGSTRVEVGWLRERFEQVFHGLYHIVYCRGWYYIWRESGGTTHE
jgi:hypothetical protein